MYIYYIGNTRIMKRKVTDILTKEERDVTNKESASQRPMTVSPSLYDKFQSYAQYYFGFQKFTRGLQGGSWDFKVGHEYDSVKGMYKLALKAALTAFIKHINDNLVACPRCGLEGYAPTWPTIKTTFIDVWEGMSGRWIVVPYVGDELVFHCIGPETQPDAHGCGLRFLPYEPLITSSI
jgi:hypothetical protein